MTSAILTVDLGFGDAGKGTMVDALVRLDKNPSVVIRTNGGCQAAHNVVTDEGLHHTFAQFGSGTFAGATTILSKDVMVSPTVFLKESKALAEKGISNPLSLVTCDERSLVTTPYHRAINRMREFARGDKRHGSCGCGIGETKSYAITRPQDAIYLSDLNDPFHLRTKLRKLRAFAVDVGLTLECDPNEPKLNEGCMDILYDPNMLETIMQKFASFKEQVKITNIEGIDRAMKGRNLVFEAAQGVLLDEDFGFHPFTTWSHTTLVNAYSLLNEVDYSGPVERIGILRSYMVRHGPGPLPSESDKIPRFVNEKHNEFSPWQRSFRMGWLDLVMLKYAIQVVGKLDRLALTHMDVIGQADVWPVCRSYDDGPQKRRVDLGNPLNPNDFVAREQLARALMETSVNTVSVASAWYKHVVGEELGVPVEITSHGPKPSDKRF